jgi:hypothetical protein
MPTITEKTCPRCGRVFTCHQESGCWCNEVVLRPETLAKLRERYSDCLCEDCLRAFGVEHETSYAKHGLT